MPPRTSLTAVSALVLSLLFLLAHLPATHAYLGTQPPSTIDFATEWRQTHVGSPAINSVDWSPDGEMIAVGTGNGKLVILSENGTLLWDTEDLGGKVRSVSWSPKGDMIAAGTQWSDKVYVFSRNGSLLWESDGLYGTVKIVAWSPSGDMLAAVSYSIVYVFSSNGTLIWNTTELDGEVWNIDWSPDSSMLAVSGDFSKVYVYSSNGTLVWNTSDISYSIEGIKWSPDGSKIAVMLEVPSDIYVYSSNGTLLWSDHLGNTGYFDWSPDGSMLAVGVLWSPVVKVYSSNGTILWNNANPFFLDEDVVAIDWSPDGSKIAVGTEWDDENGSHGRVIVFQSNGTLLWNSTDLGNHMKRVTWDSSGEKLAAKSGFPSYKLYMFSSNGTMLWESHNLGDEIPTVSWSPDGTMLGVGTDNSQKAIVYSQNGTMLWESGDLGGTVKSISWSPDGSMVAVLTGFGSYMLYVFSSNGTFLWSPANIGENEEVLCISWSPDGSMIAAGTSWGYVYVYSSSGTLLWNTSNLGDWVKSVAWSPDGSMLAVGGDFAKVIVFSRNGTMLWESDDLYDTVKSISWNPNGTALAAAVWKKVYVFSSNGTLLWQSERLINWIYEVSWSPSGDMLAAKGSGRVFMFSQNGTLLWNTTYLGGLVEGISWSPDSSMIIVGGDFGKAIVFSQNGTLLWNTTYLGGEVLSVSWSPVEEGFAVSTSTGEVIYYVRTEVGQLQVEGQPGTQIYITGAGGSWNGTMSGNGTLALWASPGEYNITYTLPEPQGFIGDPGALHGVIEATVHSNTTTNITLPGYQDLLGSLEIHAPPNTGVNITVSWPGGSTDYQLSGNETLVIQYAAPDTYNITYTLPEPQGFIGDPSALQGTLQAIVEANQTTGVELPGYNDLLGTVVIQGVPGTQINISWTGGSIGYEIPGNGTVYIPYAAPGSYNISYQLPTPDNFVGEPGILQGNVESAVSPGITTSVELPGYDDLLGSMEIHAPPDAEANITVSWPDGTAEYQLPGNGTLSLWASPGEYNITYVLPEPQDFIGDPAVLQGMMLANISAGASVILEIPGYQDLLGVLEISGTANTTLIISWTGGNAEYLIPEDNTLSLWASPGEYNITYILPTPENFIGDAGVLQARVNAVVDANATTNVKLPGYYDLLGVLLVSGTPGAEINISWTSGYWNGSIPDDQTLSLWASPGIYNITYSLPEPQGFIGNPAALQGTTHANVQANQTTFVTLPGYQDLLGILVIEGEPGTNVNIAWTDGSAQYEIPDNTTLILWASPGTYNLTYQLPIPEGFVGDPGILEGDTTATVSANTTTEIQLPGYEELLGVLIVEGLPGAQVNVSWTGGSVKFEVPGNGTLIIPYVAPGGYNITYQLPIPSNFVGDPAVLEGTINVNVIAGQTTSIQLPGYQDLLGSLEIQGLPGTTVNISWIDGSTSLTLPDNSTLSLWAAPGQFNIAYQLPVPEGFIGDQAVLEGSIETIVYVNTTSDVMLPGYQDLLGIVEVHAPTDTSANITISWEEGTVNYTITENDTLTLWAAPATYNVSYALPEPQGFIGSPEALQGTLQAVVEVNQTTQLQLPSLQDLLGSITIQGVPGTLVNITWTGGNAEYEIPSNGTLQIPYAAPEEYDISYQLPEPQGFIGDPGVLLGGLQVLVSVNETTIVNLPGYNDLLGTLALNASESIGANITITWHTGSSTLTIGAGESVELWATPGEYNVSYSLPVPDGFIGDPSILQGVLQALVYVNQTTSITLPGYEDLLGSIRIQAPTDASVNISIAWETGSTSLTLNAGGNIQLWAAPGPYNISYQLSTPPLFVGNTSALHGLIQANVPIGGTPVVEIPGYNNLLGILNIQGETGTYLNVTWTDGSAEFQIPDNATLILWASPGIYNITYVLPEPQGFLGDPKVLEANIQETIQINQTTSITLPGYEELLGSLEIHAPAESSVNITVSWPGGSTDYQLSGNETLVIQYAAPGTYNITYTLPEPQGFIGDSSALQGTLQAVIEANQTTSTQLPGYQDILGSMIIQGLADAEVNITWTGGSMEYEIPNNGTLSISYVAPGEYNLTYQLPIPQGFIGESGVLQGSIKVHVTANTTTNATLPGYQDLLGSLEIQAPSSSGVEVVIEWLGGESTYPLTPGEHLDIPYAAPGSYDISYNLPAPPAFIGDPGVLQDTLQATVQAGSTTTLQIPGYPEKLGFLTVSAPPGTIITVSWPTGTMNFTVPDNGSLSLWAEPGEYNVTFTYQNRTATTTLNVTANQTTSIEAPESLYQPPSQGGAGNETTNQTTGGTGTGNQTSRGGQQGKEGIPLSLIGVIAAIAIIAVAYVILSKR